MLETRGSKMAQLQLHCPSLWAVLIEKKVEKADRFIEITLTESIGYITQCSKIPAIEPAIMCVVEFEVGKDSYSSNSAIFHVR